ncbi:MAG: hypothetical protein Q9Q13_12505 [Acidobacteriota bacterium]|nr:hypothetical protein [Acidobacteriota bacterium]
MLLLILFSGIAHVEAGPVIHLLPVRAAHPLPAELRSWSRRLTSAFWQPARRQALAERWPGAQVILGPPADASADEGDTHYELRGRLEVEPVRLRTPVLHLSAPRAGRWLSRRIEVVEARGLLRYTFTLVATASGAEYATGTWTVAWIAPPPPDDRYLPPPHSPVAWRSTVLEAPDNLFHGEWSPEPAEGPWPPPGLENLVQRLRRRRTITFGHLLEDSMPLRLAGLADLDHQPLPAGMPLTVRTRHGTFATARGPRRKLVLRAGPDPVLLEDYRPPACSTAVVDVFSITPAAPAADAPPLEILRVNTSCLGSWLEISIDSRRSRADPTAAPRADCRLRRSVAFDETRRARLILELGPNPEAEVVDSGHVFRSFPVTRGWWVGAEFSRRRSSSLTAFCPDRPLQRKTCAQRQRGRIADRPPAADPFAPRLLVVTTGDADDRILEIRPPRWRTRLGWTGTATCQAASDAPSTRSSPRSGDLVTSAEYLVAGPDRAFRATLPRTAQCFRAAPSKSLGRIHGGCEAHRRRENTEIRTRFSWTLHLH